LGVDDGGDAALGESGGAGGVEVRVGDDGDLSRGDAMDEVLG